MIMVITVDVWVGIAAGLITLFAYALTYGPFTAFGDY